MSHSSRGPDQIPAKALKFILPSIVSPFTILLNLSLVNGAFPTALKSTRLFVVHEGGSRKVVLDGDRISAAIILDVSSV